MKSKFVTLALLPISLVSIASCSNGDSKSAPPLTEDVVRSIGMKNFEGSSKPDASVLKDAWCERKYTQFMSDNGASSESELDSLLAVDKGSRPRNGKVTKVTDVRSIDDQGVALVDSTIEIPQADGKYKTVARQKDAIRFKREAGQWRLCDFTEDQVDPSLR
ncbi:hypothetical protein [Gordonia malaquae]|uniref:hypothetical protein n=1 Tax=Gordonia malaquae TaxID=410332 RepID=UPI003016ABF0